MVSKEELYVLIDEKIYRKNKSDILGSQVNLLKIKKHLQNLEVLSRQKKELKIRLAKILESTDSIISEIQEKFPEPKIPKKIRRGEEITGSIKKISLEREDIDDELEQIQEKLR